MRHCIIRSSFSSFFSFHFFFGGHDFFSLSSSCVYANEYGISHQQLIPTRSILLFIVDYVTVLSFS